MKQFTEEQWKRVRPYYLNTMGVNRRRPDEPDPEGPKYKLLDMIVNWLDNAMAELYEGYNEERLRSLLAEARKYIPELPLYRAHDVRPELNERAELIESYLELVTHGNDDDPRLRLLAADADDICTASVHIGNAPREKYVTSTVTYAALCRDLRTFDVVNGCGVWCSGPDADEYDDNYMPEEYKHYTYAFQCKCLKQDKQAIEALME